MSAVAALHLILGDEELLVERAVGGFCVQPVRPRAPTTSQ